MAKGFALLEDYCLYCSIIASSTLMFIFKSLFLNILHALCLTKLVVFLFGRYNLFLRCIFRQMYFADEELPYENAE